MVTQDLCVASPGLQMALHIASGGDFGDSTVQIWAALSGNLLYTHKQQYRIFGVAWSPDRKRIASGSFDGSVQTWDAMTGIDIVSTEIIPAQSTLPPGLQMVLISPLEEKIRLIQVWEADYREEHLHV